MARRRGPRIVAASAYKAGDMRFRDYPSAGRPAALTADLEELLVLVQGAVESTNVERWALAFGAVESPVLPGTLRTGAYETDVVGSIHRLGQRYWERRGEAAVWERPFPTGASGRPPAVDIALFSDQDKRETRLEFGMCSTTKKGTLTKSKLRDDAAKLAGLTDEVEQGFEDVENYVILWHEYQVKLSQEMRRRFRRTMQDHVDSISTAELDHSIELLMTSGGHLFESRHGHDHWLAIALFSISA